MPVTGRLLFYIFLKGDSPMEDYKSNSHKAREKESKRAEAPPKKVEKVVSGIAKVQKKSGVQKFAGALVSDDMEKVKSYNRETLS